MRRLVLAMIALGASGCISRAEVEAAAWLNNGLPADLCAAHPELNDYGFYRRLDAGGLEFIPFCNPLAKDITGFYKDDLKRILDALLPKPKARDGR